MDNSAATMKVLFVRSGNSSIDPISTNQGESLQKEGIDIEFFYIKGRGLIGYLSNIRKLRKFVRIYKPDLIHSHYSFSGILASFSFSGVPVGVSLMGSDVNFSAEIILFLLRFFSRHIWKFTIVKSRKMYEKLRVKSVFIIPNGVNFESFRIFDKYEAQAYLGWDNKCKHIIFASDPNRVEKNFTLANAAIKVLFKQNFVIEVHFLKDIQPLDMMYYYSAADVLLMTSIAEGSPNVIKEAMACNCPIVSTDVGDVKEVMKDIPGTYIVSNNTESVAEGLAIALEFNSRTAGRENIKEFDSSKIAGKLISIYKTLITVRN
jgi:glycosyltransferase involved in cell wall biosynthesis